MQYVAGAIKKNQKHTARGIPTWSPTVVLISRSVACVCQSGRDGQFSTAYGRMCWDVELDTSCLQVLLMVCDGMNLSNADDANSTCV